MKTLTLLRHAKSGWDDPVARDFDRPLNAKGKRAAQLMGRELRRMEVNFDHVIASPAVRVTETIDEISAGYGDALAPVWEKRIYLASAATLLDVVHDLPDSTNAALLVGHNPGIEDLVLLLVAENDDNPLRDIVELKYPTASVAVLHLPAKDWADVAPASATLTAFVRPRDLDPSLGPDQD